MNNQTLEKLRQMRLFGMHDAFKTSLENTIKEKMTQDQFVSHLVHSEWDNRKNRAVERAVRAAQFRYNATLDDVDYTFERGLDRNQVERLAAMEFVRDHKDLIITGPTGTGKSYLATALGYKACQDGFRVMYASTAKLMSQLKNIQGQRHDTGRPEAYRTRRPDDPGRLLHAAARRPIARHTDGHHRRPASKALDHDNLADPRKGLVRRDRRENHRRRRTRPHRTPLAAR